uniref:Uncharacterized protein n=1 Tax=Oryza barthii TaxID=65489 RepID=A0A0D3HC01_9ORYZ
MLDQQSKEPELAILVYIKGAFCTGQLSQSTSFVPDVCREEFVSTFHLPSRRAVRRRLMFGYDNVPIMTSDSYPILSISLLAAQHLLSMRPFVVCHGHSHMLLLSHVKNARQLYMIRKREEKLYAAIYSPSSRSIRRRIIPNDNVVHQQCHTQLQQQNLSSASHQGDDGS